jgi:IS5 family transposase
MMWGGAVIRFKKSTQNSVCGDVFLRYANGKDHFLFRLGRVIGWDEFTPVFVKAYKGGARIGEAPYHPLVLFKMLLLAHLFKTSERAVEDLCTWYIPARLFIGLGAIDSVPDHSTLSVFKRRLKKHAGIADFEAIFDGIILQAVARGVQFGSIQIVDSVHTVANVNNEKDRERHEQGKPSADPDATLVHKGKRKVTKADGGVEQQELMHLGYKTHVSLDAETGLVTSIKPTTGCSADNKQMPDLIEHDMRLGIPGQVYTADKAYDDGDLHELLKTKGKRSAIHLTKQRTEKKDDSKGPWLAQIADPLYQAGLKVRYRIERTFGEAKLWHHLGQCRSRGLLNFKIQSYMTFMVINLKRLVYLTTGIRLRQVLAR